MSFLVMAGRLAGLRTKGATSSLSRYFSGTRTGGSKAWRNETPQGSKTEVFVYSPESTITWPDPQLGVLGSTDPNFNLPGHIGTSLSYPPRSDQTTTKKSYSDVLTTPTNKEKQIHALYNAHDYIKYTPGSEEQVCLDMLDEFPKIIGVENVEFGVHETPVLLRKEMASMFPGQNLESGAFTCITYSHNTVNDMSKWSEQVETEREVEVERFVQTAQEICGRLREEGHWADFIDPCSGTPFYGAHTNSTMFETDEKFSRLGFEIEDLGCCKVIMHPTFGRNVFVGCIVTNAGKNNPVIDEIVDDVVS